MTTLKDAALWCCRLEVPWKAEDVAQMAATALPATRAYLSRLEAKGVVRAQPDGSYMAGDPKAIHDLRATPTNAKPGGGGAIYRQGKAARDRLLTAEAEARRSGLLTRHNETPRDTMGHGAKPRDLILSEPGLTKAEYAEAMRTTTRTIDRWIASGRISFFKTPGGFKRIPVSELTGSITNASRKEAAQ